MHQIGQPLPDGARLCERGHHPQLIESRGTPRGQTLIGRAVPPQFHVECVRCNTATVPALTTEKALKRWNANRPSINQIPLCDLGLVRQRVFDAIATAA